MNDGAKICSTIKDLLHRSPVVKHVGQRRAATDQSATSPIGFGLHMKIMMVWILSHDINLFALLKVEEYGHVEGDTPAEQEVVFMNNLNIVASAPHRQCNTNMSGCHDD